MPDRTSDLIFNGRRGAVSLTFDDGTPNQLVNAVPPLDDRDLRATFYLNPRDSLMDQFLEDWQRVGMQGHEIGNHTLTHPCPSAITGGKGLEDMTLDEVEADILAAQHRIDAIAPHQRERTFAYPCYSTYVGRGEDRRSYVPIVSRHFLAGRGGGEYGFGNHPDLLDLAALVGTAVERLSAQETVALIQRLTSGGHWVILVFHDIAGEVLSVSLDDYIAILDYLYSRRTEILTAPVIEIASIVATRHTLPATDLMMRSKS